MMMMNMLTYVMLVWMLLWSTASFFNFNNEHNGGGIGVVEAIDPLVSSRIRALRKKRKSLKVKTTSYCGEQCYKPNVKKITSLASSKTINAIDADDLIADTIEQLNSVYKSKFFFFNCQRYLRYFTFLCSVCYFSKQFFE